MTMELAQTSIGTAPSRIAARALSIVETVLETICGALLAILLAVVLVTVVLRYAFGTGLLGSEDLSVWLHLALIALGAPLAINSALAMRLDVFVRLMPKPLQALASVIADVFVVLTGLIFLFGSAKIVSMLGGISPTLGLPEWVRFSVFGVGGGLILLVVALQFIAERRFANLAAAFIIGGALYFAIPFVHFPAGWPPSFVLGLISFVGLVVAAPLPHAFFAAAYIAMAFGSTMPEQAIVSTTVTGMSKFLLLAIPFFLLAGGLLTASGVAGHLVRFAASLVGHKRGGLAQTTLLTSVLFSGASGSSVANAAFGASTFQPPLVERGYSPAKAGAIIASTSVLDNVIPPSIAFLILAAATNLSVGSLLVGGFIAGGIMAVCLGVSFYLTAHDNGLQERATGRDRLRFAVAAIPAFGLGVIVVVGIRMGVVTTTEAAALAAVYTLALGVTRIDRKSLFSAFGQAAREASAIGLLIGTAAPFAFLLAVDGVSNMVANLASSLGSGPVGVLLLSNLILLVAGLFLDIGAAILLLSPILMPVAVAAGIDPIHFGVIIVVNLMIGGLTPPVGMLVYVVSGVTRVPATALFRAILPYLFALLVALAILCAGALVL